ncbi:MAG: HAMP domain-containing sensor histidine kinase [Bdellovibrionota bacterium]
MAQSALAESVPAIQTIADLVHSDLSVPADTPIPAVEEIFEKSPRLDSLAVLDGDQVGVVFRSRFFGQLRGRFGYALYQSKPIRVLTEKEILAVDAGAPPVEVINLALQRSVERIYDDILVLEGEQYRGIVSMRYLMVHGKDLLLASLADVSALEEQNRRLEEISRLQREFVANMTHELRAPLNAMVAAARVITDDEGVSGERRRDARMLVLRGKDLLAIVGDLLDFYKLESGQMNILLEEIDPRLVLEEAAEATAYLLQGRPISLEQEFASLPSVVRTDPVFLRRVLVNLLSNAAKFTDEGRVTLKAEGRDGNLWIEVSDTGTGIRPEDLPRLFSKFTQLESAKTRRHGGTGLGLAIVKDLVGLLGGEVSVQSEWSKGSTFTVKLPLSRA